HLPQGRQEEITGVTMASKLVKMEFRRSRVRKALRAAGKLRPRLSVFRSAKNIYAHVIDDQRGMTLAAASTLEEGFKTGGKTGGERFGFGALVVVGDRKGRVGVGHGKAREVPEAVRKATESAKRGLVRVPLREGRTLHHDVNGRWGAGKVVLRSAPPGTGIIAGGPMRAVFESLGMQDVVAKSKGSSN